MISIALPVYNGAKYVVKQLESYASQSILPDEVIICDDLSTDNTLDLICSYKKKAIYNIKIYQNSVNIGYQKNFEKAISLSTGDIIFLSDQDDYWFSDKIKYAIDVFNKHKNIFLVVNDQEITDSSLIPSGKSMFSNAKKLGYNDSWIVAGCCSSFRKELKDIIIPFPVEKMQYDQWIHHISNLLNVRYVLPQVLQYYRRHPSNASNSVASHDRLPSRFKHIMSYGLKDVSSMWTNDVWVSRFLQQRIIDKEYLISGLGISLANNIIYSEKQKCSAFNSRIELVNKPKLKRLKDIYKLYISGGYSYFSGFNSAIKDIIR